MKKFKNTSELLWLLGIIFVPMGIAICNLANLGVSMVAAPGFVLFDFVRMKGIWSSATVGVMDYICQGTVLVTLCCIIMKFRWQYLIAFLVSVIQGYSLNFFVWLFGDITISSVAMRYFLLIAGDVITAFGVACFFRTTLQLQVYEMFVMEFAKVYKTDVPKTKWIYDISLLTISAIMAFALCGDAGEFDWNSIWTGSFHHIGVGTVITTIINATLIKYMGKIIDRFFEPTPLFKKWDAFYNK